MIKITRELQKKVDEVAKKNGISEQGLLDLSRSTKFDVFQFLMGPEVSLEQLKNIMSSIDCVYGTRIEKLNKHESEECVKMETYLKKTEEMFGELTDVPLGELILDESLLVDAMLKANWKVETGRLEGEVLGYYIQHYNTNGDQVKQDFARTLNEAAKLMSKEAARLIQSGDIMKSFLPEEFVIEFASNKSILMSEMIPRQYDYS